MVGVVLAAIAASAESALAAGVELRSGEDAAQARARVAAHLRASLVAGGR